MKAFEALGEENSIILVFDRLPRALFDRLTAERAGFFAWETLEDGPLTWRVRLGHRPPRCFESRLEDLIARDIGEISATIAFIREDLEEGCRKPHAALPAVRARVATLVPLVARFLAEQESCFLPMVELEHVALRAREGRLLRLQMEELSALLSRAERLLSAPSPCSRDLDVASEALREMALLLDDIARRERDVYVPLAEKTMSPKEEKRLVGLMALM
jgi:hypothetical protein